MSTMTSYREATIEADPTVPMIHIYRDFDATIEQLMRAHTDPELFVKWVGPKAINAKILEWDVRPLGSYRYVCEHDGDEHVFSGTFPQITDTKIVQTFSWAGMPDAIALETMTFEDLGDGRTRLHGQSLCDSFEGRDGMLSSGMDTGVHEGYAKLDELLAQGL